MIQIRFQIKLIPYILVLSIGLISCEKDAEVIIEKYNTGQIKMKSYLNDNQEIIRQELFYPDGLTKLVQEYQNGTKNGVFMRFYENGNIAQSGFMKNGLREGLFYHYYEKDSGIVSSIAEIFNVGDQEMMLYAKKYDKEGELIKEYRDFEFISLPDTLIQDQEIEYFININSVGEEDSTVLITGPFNDRFTFIKGLDTVMVTGNNVKLRYSSNTLGVNCIRGRLIEYNNVEVKGDTLIEDVSHKFFEKKIYVIPSPSN